MYIKLKVSPTSDGRELKKSRVETLDHHYPLPYTQSDQKERLLNRGVSNIKGVSYIEVLTLKNQQ